MAEIQGVKNFLVITFIVANSKSLFFYSQVKGKIKKYRPILAKDVAKSMYIAVLRNLSGIHIYNPEEIKMID